VLTVGRVLAVKSHVVRHVPDSHYEIPSAVVEILVARLDESAESIKQGVGAQVEERSRQGHVRRHRLGGHWQNGIPAQVRNDHAEQVWVAPELDPARAGFAKVAEEAGGKVVWAVKLDLGAAQYEMCACDGDCVFGVEIGVGVGVHVVRWS
jgi:hypothetical protein